MTDRPLLRIIEAAQILGIDRKTVGRWVRAGVLPVVEDPDTGTKWIPRASLDRWLAEQQGRAS
jgi:excisionase family DNA binding protein